MCAARELRKIELPAKVKRLDILRNFILSCKRQLNAEALSAGGFTC
jgi:hypothetical protein